VRVRVRVRVRVGTWASTKLQCA